ncbi:MAG TPA: polysaccharide biosynthesis/export family protein, partial [Candidatus Acidoferrales bacterium]
MIRKQVLSSANRLSLMITFAVLVIAGPLYGQGASQDPKLVQQNPKTAEELNQRLEQLRLSLTPRDSSGRSEDYSIGPEDLLEISVFEAPELNRSVRVSAGGEIALTLLGPV